MIMVLTLSDFLITTVHIAAEMRTKRLLIAEKTAERKKVRPCFARPLMRDNAAKIVPSSTSQYAAFVDSPK